MIRTALVCVFLFVMAVTGRGASPVQNEPPVVSVSSTWRGDVVLDVQLSAAVPFRVFALDAPRRLVIDLKDMPPAELATVAALAEHAAFRSARMGPFSESWMRLVVDLSQPFLPGTVALLSASDGKAPVLRVALAAVDTETFARKAGPPPALKRSRMIPPAPRRKDDAFVVVLDPGHGGIDPGAQRGGVSEKTLVLGLAHDLADRLGQKRDVHVHLTREADVFVSLEARVAQAQALHADLFVSLHADALPDGGAEGATIYTLSDTASDAATAQLAARHNRSDVLAGIDLTGAGDSVTQVLLDIARRETRPRSDMLARVLARDLDRAGVPMNNLPLREAGFAVLKSADIPSVLVEVGFLSSARDLANLQDSAWREKAVEGLASAILRWRALDADRETLPSR